MDQNANQPVKPVKSANQENTWAMFCHLGTLFGGIIPFASIVVPLVIWQINKDSSFISQNGKESLNFQISILIYFLISFVLIFVLVGFLLLFAIFILDIVFVIKASLAATNGRVYHYPLAIKFIK